MRRYEKIIEVLQAKVVALETLVSNQQTQLANQQTQLAKVVALETLVSNQQKQLANQQHIIRTLQKEKECREVMYHLKDFDVYCKVATKIRLGRIQHLCEIEKMCLNGMIRKPRATYKRSLQGLFQRQNTDGHVSFVTKFMVESIRNLYLRNMDIFRYYGIQGGSPQEVNGLLTRTLNSIPIVRSYLKTKRSVAHARKC